MCKCTNYLTTITHHHLVVGFLKIQKMNSLKIKNKELQTTNGECIAQIVALPENNQFRLYVAWENEAAAIDGFMAFYKSRGLYRDINPAAIEETKNYGFDIGHTPECTRIFKHLFTK